MRKHRKHIRFGKLLPSQMEGARDIIFADDVRSMRELLERFEEGQWEMLDADGFHLPSLRARAFEIRDKRFAFKQHPMIAAILVKRVE